MEEEARAAHVVNTNMKIEILIMIVLLFAAAEDFYRKEISFWMPAVCGVISMISIIMEYLHGEIDILNILLATIPGVILLLLAFATGQEIGYGDGLMALSIAPALGFEKTCFVLFISMTLSSLYSILYLIIEKSDKKSTFPFMPFLAAGMGVALLAKV